MSRSWCKLRGADLGRSRIKCEWGGRSEGSCEGRGRHTSRPRGVSFVAGAGSLSTGGFREGPREGARNSYPLDSKSTLPAGTLSTLEQDRRRPHLKKVPKAQTGPDVLP